MSKSCLTCQIHDKFNKKTVPKWYKDIGNDSLLPPILNSNSNYKIKNIKKFKDEKPKITDIEVKVEIDDEEPNKWLFYWASNPQEEYSFIKDPIKAYDNEQNHGLIKLDKNGKAKITLNCPQPYKVDNITYPRHVHYTIEENGEWSDNIRTYIITCHVNDEQFEDIMKNKTHIILNALDEKSFDDFHIPNSFNLYHASMEKMNKGRKKNMIKKFIKNILKHYPDLERLVGLDKKNPKHLDILDIPIVTYCSNEKCNASKKLLDHIVDCGFTNVLEYPGGIKSYIGKNKKSKKTSDDITTEDIEVKNDDIETEIIEYLEDSDLTEDLYNLDITLERLIYEDIKYYHNIENEEIYDSEKNLVGLWDGSKIKWDTVDEKYKHEKRVEKRNEGIEDIVDNEDKPIVKKKTENKNIPHKGKKIKVVKEEDKKDDKLQELKNILGSKKISKKGQKPKNTFFDSISVKDKNYMSNDKFNEQHMGWGLTFFT